MDFGASLQKYTDRELDKQSNEAAINRMSNAVVKLLKETIGKYEQKYKVRLGMVGPAKGSTNDN